ncbi:MAG: hypothetical protein F6K14_02500 [Symploca sp. SIO2C1]|nr:hypothetical protein [Symploca sp. SIO2C1]
MKMNKIMIATALATGTLLGAFMESAEAIDRRRGHAYSGGSSATLEIDLKFDLFDINQNGKPIKDQDKRSELGLFQGAIENFKFMAIEALNPVAGFSFSSSFKRLNLKTEIGNDPKNGKEAILYSFVDAEMKEVFPTPPEDIFLEDTPDLFFSLVIEDNSGIDQYQAINNLEYILSNDIFGKAYQTRADPPGEFSFEPIQETINSQAVPESNSINNLLALGSLGLGVLLKRKIKQN